MRLLETIRISDGKAENLHLHQARLERAQLALFGRTTGIDLSSLIRTTALPERGIFKCRIEYDTKVREFSLTPYVPRVVEKLALLKDDTIEYHHKFCNRERLKALQAAAWKLGADEVIILKKGCITDTSFSNLVFSDGKKWWTPAQPLLSGTRRAQLLDAGLIHPMDIRPEDLGRFCSLRLINAMLPLESGIDIPIGQVLV